MILSKDNVDAANNPKNKLVKHGFGIYIYKANDGQTTKYEVFNKLYRDIGIEIKNKVKVN